MVKTGKRLQLAAITLFIFNGFLYSQGYSIKLKAPDFAGKDVILAEYFTSRMVPKDTIQLNSKGAGAFSGNTSFDGGLYVIFFDSRHYFDFLLDKNQHISIFADSSDLVGKTVFRDSEINTEFYRYKLNVAEKRKEQQSLLDQLAVARNKSDSSLIQSNMDELNKGMENYIEEITLKNKDNFFGTFLLAMKENNAPESIVSGTPLQQDSIRYVYYRQHYFDNFDIGDIRLLHTPLYDPKIKTYINRVATQYPDSLIVAVDKLLKASRAHDEMFRYMLITLFNNFAESKMMGMDKVYFHIAEKYYIPEATWSDAAFIEKLKDNLEKSKYTFIGNPAPDFELRGIPVEHFQMAEMDEDIKKDPHVGFPFKVSQVGARYTILYFWEADCGHCQKSTPKLYEVFEKYKNQDVKVLAVHVINSVEGKEKWIDFVNQHEMYDWVNCWSPYDNEFRKMYNLQSFPQLFLLDENKKILAKNLSPEQVDDILNRFINN